MVLELKPDERIDELGRAGLRIIQRADGTAFGLDAVLLAHFARAPKGGRVIDLGTGTGAIALLLAALTPAARIDALELDPALADMVRRSIELNCLGERVQARQGDIRDIAALYPANAYAAVVCNPPYFRVGAGRRSPSPARAAARSELTCDLDDVAAAARHLLGRRGRLFFVYRPERLVDAVLVCRRHGLEPKRMRFAAPAVGRPPDTVLIEATPGARPGLIVEPLLTIRAGSEYSSELRAIFAGEAAQLVRAGTKSRITRREG